jgi:hypothetical protein
MTFPGYFDDEPENRFMLFGHERYYPEGGQGDLLGSYATWDECEKAKQASNHELFDVFDCETRKWVNV